MPAPPPLWLRWSERAKADKSNLKPIPRPPHQYSCGRELCAESHVSRLLPQRQRLREDSASCSWGTIRVPCPVPLPHPALRCA